MSNPTSPRPTTTALTLKSVGSLDFEKGFSDDQVQLLKDAICKDATDSELRMFMYICERKKLDPFAKQIYPVKRWDNALKREVTAYQTGIDGFRVTAKRSGKYRGQTGPFWCGEDGVWRDVWLGKTPPAAAKVGVKHADFDEPVWAVATWESYVQTTKEGKPNSMWMKMCDNQLAKCAESLALRKAFPEDLSGLHTEDEMGQADNLGSDPNDKVARLAALNKKSEIKDVVSEVLAEPALDQTIAQEPEPKWDHELPLSVGLETNPIASYELKATHSLKGKKIGEIDREVLKAFLSSTKDHFKKQNKPITGAALEDITRIDDYLRVGAA